MKFSGRVQYGGVAVALSSFGVTRLFVVEALRVDAPLPFLIAGLLPLVVGLALTVYGVTLALGSFTDRYVNSVARWHLLGVGAMLVVLVVTALDGALAGEGFRFGNGGPLLVANVLLGGAIGGTLTGIRSGKTITQRREIRRSANQALLVNRLLKHEVLNAATIVDGYARMLEDGDGNRDESVGAIREAVARIQATVDEVGTMAERGGRSLQVDVGEVVREQVAALAPAGPELTVAVDTDDAEVAADGRLGIVVRELLENAADHGGERVSVRVREVGNVVELSVRDDGPGLPAAQRDLLEQGTFPEFDDPTAGFGLQIVRLLVVQFGGEIDVQSPETDGTGTKVAVRLPRSESDSVSPEAIGLTAPSIGRSILAGLLGGVAMGLFYQSTTGLLPVIGSLYGVSSPLVGWITHLFHSAVFGLLFAAVCVVSRVQAIGSGPTRAALLGSSWGVTLWIVGASVIMPVWLGLIGASAGRPQFSVLGILGHVLWGVVVGLVYWGSGELAVPERVRIPPDWTKRFT